MLNKARLRVSVWQLAYHEGVHGVMQITHHYMQNDTHECPLNACRWSGEAVDEMEGRLRDAGFKAAFPAIRVKFRPTAKVCVCCLCSCSCETM